MLQICFIFAIDNLFISRFQLTGVIKLRDEIQLELVACDI